MRNRGKVVIIEDSPDEAELLAVALSDEAFSPVLCGTAAEGLASAAEGRPVGVIIDWGLPDRPGVDVCRELRAKAPLMAIMFLSGRTDEATIARALDAGADDFVSKPFRRTELIARLEAHVRKANAAIPLLRGAAGNGPPLGRGRGRPCRPRGSSGGGGSWPRAARVQAGRVPLPERWRR